MYGVDASCCFFKQKTAYEMRISDWSSDVCSSDLLVWGGATVGLMGEVARSVRAAGGRTIGVIPDALRAVEIADHAADELIVTPDMLTRKGELARSEERRGGKECGSKCIYRWSPSH